MAPRTEFLTNNYVLVETAAFAATTDRRGCGAGAPGGSNAFVAVGLDYGLRQFSDYAELGSASCVLLRRALSGTGFCDEAR
jgi:hypothetical protein